MRSRVLIIAMGCWLVTASASVYAWGTKGHRIIAALAEQHLTAPAKAAIAEILAGEGLVQASTWADEMRSSPDNVEFWSRTSTPWHYVNIPREALSYADAGKSADGDALMAIATFSAILLGDEVPEGPVKQGLEAYFGPLDQRPGEVKAFALRFLVHVLGDLQQPLHMGYADDRGGNAVSVRWFDRTTNLHSLWDSHLVDHSDLSYSEYADRLSNRIAHTPSSDLRALQRSDPELWLTENRRLLARLYDALEGDNAYGYDYAAMFVPTVEAQLVKGGLRTAFFLNSLFGGLPLAPAAP